MYTILVLASKDLKKTHIMYKANLSHKQLKKYLRILVNKELLTKDDDTYVTTDLGLQFIDKFRDIQNVLREKNHINYAKTSLFYNSKF